jgi:hypothetical protein
MFGTIKLTTMTLACHLLLSKEEIHVNAFTSMTQRIPTTKINNHNHNNNNNNNHNNINQITAMRMSSSYEFDSDEASEQLIADKRSAYVQESQESTSTSASASTSTIPNNNLNGKITTPTKFDHVLEEVGLKGQLSSLHDLSPKRQVSRNGVFCNRELQLSGVRAIGFDMDYTIAQYKQPAFDKLAFDGAKVSKSNA